MITHTLKGLTQEQLVNLFSTALTGNNALAADYDPENEFAKKGEYFEDSLALTLLNGGTIILTDLYAEDEDDVQGEYADSTYWNEYWDAISYPITYQDILDRLNKVLSKESTDATVCAELISLLIDEEACDFDFYDGWNLVQYIMFGDVIYG